MTCPRCGREVTLIGGLCGHCSSEISIAFKESFDENVEVKHVSYSDGTYNIEFEL